MASDLPESVQDGVPMAASLSDSHEEQRTALLVHDQMMSTSTREQSSVHTNMPPTSVELDDLTPRPPQPLWAPDEPRIKYEFTSVDAQTIEHNKQAAYPPVDFEALSYSLTSSTQPEAHDKLIDDARLAYIHPALVAAEYGETRTIDPLDESESEEEEDSWVTESQQRRETFRQEMRDSTGAWSSSRVDSILAKVQELRALVLAKMATMDTQSKQKHFKAFSKIVIFCEWLSPLDLLEIALENIGIKVLRFDTTCSARERQQVIQDFEEVNKQWDDIDTQPSETYVLLATTQTFDYSPEFVHAAFVIFVTPILDAFLRGNCYGRINRIGRLYPTQVFQFLTEDSIEERVEDISRANRQGIESMWRRDTVLSQEHWLRNLTISDLFDTVARAGRGWDGLDLIQDDSDDE